jgi:hypothetical protein
MVLWQGESRVAYACDLSEGTYISRFRTLVHLVLQSTNASPFALPPFIWLYIHEVDLTLLQYPMDIPIPMAKSA